MAAPFLGSRISLISRSEIRYEGILYTIDTKESTVALQNVRSFGTEGRKKDGDQIPPSNEVYDYIIFRGADIKDLHVAEAPAPPQPRPPQDPAIISSQGQQKLPFPPQYPPPGGQFGGMPAPYQQFGQQPASQFPPAPYGYMPPYGAFPQQPMQAPPQQQPAQQPAPQQAPQPVQPQGQPQQPAPSTSKPHEPRLQSQPQHQQPQGYGARSGGRPRQRHNEPKPGEAQPQHQASQRSAGNYRGGQRRSGGAANGGSGAGRGYFNGTPQRPAATTFQDEFDLEAANAKFDKMKIFEEVQTQIAQGTQAGTGSSSAGSEAPGGPGEGQQPAPAPVIIPPAPSAYDKTKSFFDNISCDAKDRAVDRDHSKPRLSQADQRRLDQLTFGADAVRGRSRRGRGRGYSGPSRYPPSAQLAQGRGRGQENRGGRGGRAPEAGVPV